MAEQFCINGRKIWTKKKEQNGEFSEGNMKRILEALLQSAWVIALVSEFCAFEDICPVAFVVLQKGKLLFMSIIIGSISRPPIAERQAG